MARVVFLHPDLGIGGAERLVVDAALALKNKGHDVHFITTHHDEDHCFVETKNGRLSVTVVGDWLPRHIFGRFYAVCTYIRMIYAALYIVFFSVIPPDIVFCDLVSVCIPFLRMSNAKVLFYCHFPDQLLSQPGGTLKALYRAPLNWLEEVTTGQADKILVNSKFTSGVFKNTFKKLKVIPDVLYPSMNTVPFDKTIPLPLNKILLKPLPEDAFIFLSINRYERKKNLKLAIEAMSEMRKHIPTTDWDRAHLVIAGGYDKRVRENIEYHEELFLHAESSGFGEKVTFLKSPSDKAKMSLLSHCHCLIYTPPNEHFGIVPIEAMYAGKPVIAANSGGPTETVVNDSTGFLCDLNPKDFAVAMTKFIQDEEMREKFGEAGKARMKKLFSFEAFSNQLETIVNNLLDTKTD
ncbi:Alpha-1,3/1,6-mannosyltransferase ALG2 [Blattella germanica]|nr:Alpha-1,3/1,6-mannosyltransferase ALG2 [Blattella germanica]